RIAAGGRVAGAAGRVGALSFSAAESLPWHGRRRARVHRQLDRLDGFGLVGLPGLDPEHGAGRRGGFARAALRAGGGGLGPGVAGTLLDGGGAEDRARLAAPM